MSYPPDIKPLTSLRFFAAVTVVVFHLGQIMPEPPFFMQGLIRTGHLPVDFFFILSGFILSHVYQDQIVNQKVSHGEFYLRRFARLYPLHLVTLIVAGFLCLAGLGFGPIGGWDSEFRWSTFIQHLAMLNAWNGEDVLKQYNIPSWSISCEFAAYIMFPFLALRFFKIDPIRGLGISVFILLYIWFYFSIMVGKPFTVFTFRIFPEFIMGIGLYNFLKSRHLSILQSPLYLNFIMAALPMMMFMGMPDILIVAAFMAAVVVSAETARAGRSGWLSHPVLVYLGRVSYAIYLVHYIIITAVLGTSLALFGNEITVALYPLVAFIILILTLGSAAGLHHMVEVPAHRFIIQWYKRRRP